MPGQTGMKVRVSGTSRADLELLFPGIRTHEPLLPQLAEVALPRGGADRAPIPMSSRPGSRA